MNTSAYRATALTLIKHLQEPICEFLYRAKVVNFFSHNLWEKVPQEWRDSLDGCTIEELAFLSKGQIKDEFPTSLKDFVSTSLSIALPRQTVTPASTDRIFNSYHLSPKKEHELRVMGPLINSICKQLDAKWCIDIGAGQGYLSQMLVHQYGLNVLAVDQSENNIQKSIKIGTKESYVNNKRKEEEKNNKNNVATKNNKSNKSNKNNNKFQPPATTREVIPGKYVAAKMKLTQKTTLEEILQLTNEFNDQEEGEKKENFLITGLHCCGGLSPTILRMFRGEMGANESDNKKWRMRGLVLLSCCYHLVNEQKDFHHVRKQEIRKLEKSKKYNEEELKEEIQKIKDRAQHEQVDFPMSQFVAEHGVVLGRGGRLLACYAPEKWPTNPIQCRKLECTHGYRAALQVLLYEHYTEFSSTEDTAVGHIGETHSYSFSSYARHAITEKLKLPISEFLSDDYLEKFWRQYEPLLPTISMFWNLRAVLAPAIESLVLIDRQLYLEEKGIATALTPIFDPAISPRNVAIIAPQ